MQGSSEVEKGKLMSRTIMMATVIISLLGATVDAVAGGWTRQQGTGYYKIGFQIIRANMFYEPNGNKTRITPLGDYTVSVYGEYGITDWLTGIGYLPFYKRITLDRVVGRPSGIVYFPGDETSGIADMAVGVRLALVRQSPTVLGLAAMFGIPIGDGDQPNGLLTGDGEFDQLVALEAGHSFHPLPMFATAQVGFNNRTRGFSDEFRYGAQLGYTFNNLILLTIHARGVESLRNGDDSVIGGMNGLYANNQQYLEYGIEGIYLLSSAYGISLAVDTATRGRNVLSALKYSFGVSLSM